MSDLIYLLAVLACPIGMGVMMLVMMRGNHRGSDHYPSLGRGADEIARLRAEVAERRGQQFAERDSSQTPSGT